MFIAPPTRPAVLLESNSTSRVPENVTPRHRSAANPLPMPNIALPDDENNAIHPSADWGSELTRAARDAVSEKLAQKPRDFGFPHPSSAPVDKPPQFGWDYAATHRIESIPGGGLAVNLNDNCELILFPLPFIGCAIGKKPANGDLFKHMRDPSQADGLEK